MFVVNDLGEIFEVEEFDQEEQKQAGMVHSFLGTVAHYFGGFKELFKKVTDPRQAELTTYPLEGLLFTGVLMFLCQLGARSQINSKLRGNSWSVAKFKEMFGTEEVPHGDTLHYTFKKLKVAELQEVVCAMVETLIRKKVLYRWRLLQRYYTVVIDGTEVLTFRERHCEHCLTKKLSNKETLYYHHQTPLCDRPVQFHMRQQAIQDSSSPTESKIDKKPA